MKDWFIVAAALTATLVVSLVFWYVVMPRLSAPSVSKKAKLVSVAGFGLVLLALPAVGLWLLRERSIASVFALVIGWALVVRAAGWYAARKWLVPRLKAQQRAEAAANPPDAGPSAA